MIRISKIISTALIKGRLIIKVLRLGSKDSQTVYYTVPFGFDSNPNLEYRAVYANTGEKGDNVLIGIINNNAIASFGESRMFSNDLDGNEITSIHLTNEGIIKIGGEEDNMVRYSKLEEAYNELNDKFNDLVVAFNQHMHATAAPGPPSPPTSIPNIIPASASDGDITPSKIDEILTSAEEEP